MLLESLVELAGDAREAWSVLRDFLCVWPNGLTCYRTIRSLFNSCWGNFSIFLRMSPLYLEFKIYQYKLVYNNLLLSFKYLHLSNNILLLFYFYLCLLSICFNSSVFSKYLIFTLLILFIPRFLMSVLLFLKKAFISCSLLSLLCCVF